MAWSICQLAAASGRPLIVNDTHQHPNLVDHPAVKGLAVAAYAGVPLTVPGGQAIGTVCVIDYVRRDWIDDQLSFLACLARIITEELTIPRWHPHVNPPPGSATPAEGTVAEHHETVERSAHSGLPSYDSKAFA